MSIEFGGSKEKGIVGFADADWASIEENRKSRSGFTIFMDGDLISWYSKL